MRSAWRTTFLTTFTVRKCLTIAVVNQKGGVGKTTVSVNLAYGLALAGKQVLLIDMDMQAHSSVIYCPELPANREKGTIAEALLDRACDIRDLIRPAMVHGEPVYNLDIIPSNIHLGMIAERIASRTYREKLLHNHLATVRDKYDFIILDCPPAVGVVAVNALYTADLILIPTNYSRYALDGIADLFASIDEVKEGRGTYRILRNGLPARLMPPRPTSTTWSACALRPISGRRKMPAICASISFAVPRKPMRPCGRKAAWWTSATGSAG